MTITARHTNRLVSRCQKLSNYIMTKVAVLCVGFFVFLVVRSTSVLVGGQSFEQPPSVVPDIRQLLYAPMSVLDSGTTVTANPNPCNSLDAQYPDRPCSQPQQLPTPDYLPTPTLAPFDYQPQSVQTLPQYESPPLPPGPAANTDFPPYPYVKQLEIDRTPITPDDEVPSQYV